MKIKTVTASIILTALVGCMPAPPPNSPATPTASTPAAATPTPVASTPAATTPTPVASTPTATTPTGSGVKVSFAKDVQPILASCAMCHSGSTAPNLTASSAFDSLLKDKGSKSGKNIVVAGKSAESTLYISVNGGDTSVSKMPMGGAALAADKVKLIKDWIDQGAANN